MVPATIGPQSSPEDIVRRLLFEALRDARISPNQARRILNRWENQ